MYLNVSRCIAFSELYGSIKRWGNSLEGIASQCVKVNKVREAKMDYISNVLLKVNLKLGGHNSLPPRDGLKLLDEVPTIVFGADVYHAPPGSSRPSFSALVAAIDAQCTEWRSEVGAQPSRTEPIVHLEEMVFREIVLFHEHRGTYPRRLILYRDGVAHSQFRLVHSFEVQAVRRACERARMSSHSSYSWSLRRRTTPASLPTRAAEEEQAEAAATVAAAAAAVAAVAAAA